MIGLPNNPEYVAITSETMHRYDVIEPNQALFGHDFRVDFMHLNDFSGFGSNSFRIHLNPDMSTG